MAEENKIRMTADEFLKLPETNLPVQLLDGWVIRFDAFEPTQLTHQDTLGNTAILLNHKVQEFGGKVYIAPVDVYLDDLNVPQSDVIWLLPIQNAKWLARNI
jgi:hypothetical protein